MYLNLHLKRIARYEQLSKAFQLSSQPKLVLFMTNINHQIALDQFNSLMNFGEMVGLISF